MERGRLREEGERGRYREGGREGGREVKESDRSQHSDSSSEITMINQLPSHNDT